MVKSSANRSVNVSAGMAISSALLVCLMGATTVLAVEVPSAAQLEKRFETPPEPLSSARSINIPETMGSDAPEGSESVVFTLNSIVIDGAAIFDRAQLEPLYQPLLNREVSLKSIYDLAAELTRYYADRGYLLSRAVVPPQTVDAGKVRIQVVEGSVDAVQFLETDDLPTAFLDSIAEKIIASKPLTIDVLERYLLLLNDLPGVQFKAVLSPSANTVGASSLQLTAEPAPYQTRFTLDNRGSESSGPIQILVEGDANNLASAWNRTTLRAATVPDATKELRYIELSHQRVLSDEGTSFNLGFSRSVSEPGDAGSRLFDVNSKSDSLSLGLNFPLIRSRETNFSANLGLAIRSSEIESLAVANPTQDKLRVLSAGLVYDHADQFMGGGVSLVSLSYRQGLSVLNAQVETRGTAEPEFGLVSLFARRNQVISERWRGDMRLSAQLADDTLPSSEQAGLGGESTVRGFEPSEWSGEQLLAASLELAYRHPEPGFENTEFYGYYDVGSVRLRYPQPGETQSVTARSTGVGSRIKLGEQHSLNIELAKPLTRDSEGSVPGAKLLLRWQGQF